MPYEPKPCWTCGLILEQWGHRCIESLKGKIAELEYRLQSWNDAHAESMLKMVSEEREECARIAEYECAEDGETAGVTGWKIADAIRARK